LKKRTALRTILVIDDDRISSRAIAEHFGGDSVEVVTAHTGKDGVEICKRRKVDVVLLDQNLPDTEGHSLCPEILRQNENAKIIFITAYPSFDKAVNAVKAGAFDYLSKPFELEELSLAVERSLKTLSLETAMEVSRYKSGKEGEKMVLVGAAKGLAEVRALADTAASVDAPVLITGETGTGKNVTAKYIHYQCPARKGAFIFINCAALPESLIEAELFGYEKGAFTGAVAAKKGIFEMAEGGTLLLDEIGEMPLNLQSKLLGVLEDRCIRRLGGESIRPVDVRVIATTNVDLDEAVGKNSFRKDLYYRLSVVRIHMPPLRDRLEDLPELCEFLMQRSPLSKEAVLDEEEISRLAMYGWPGNIRELHNILERSLMLSQGKSPKPSSLLDLEPPDPAGAAGPAAMHIEGGMPTLGEMEKSYIISVIKRLENNHTHAAKALGISRSTLMRKLKDYKLA